jgi:hypothetical protein
LAAVNSQDSTKDRTKDMPENASRRGAADMGMILMIAAFAVLGGFMYWISGEAAEERANRPVAEAPVEEPDPGIQDVRFGDNDGVVFPDDYLGQVIRGAGYEVASMLGSQGFWVATPSGNPFLITWNETLMAEGRTVAQGDIITVEGEIREMDPSAIAAWVTAQTISENDQIVAEFATHYLRAQNVDVTGGPGATGDGN